MSGRRDILATYRLQLRPGFGFEAARGVLPYLQSLGITHLYLSPVFQARAGSEHGYDVTDPTRFNPELGTGGEFDALAREAAEKGMGLILDVVPNHMGVSHENPYWVDVLEYGAASRYAQVFDIDWNRTDPARRRILIPCLGQPYGRVLESGELRLELEPSGLCVRYYDRRFPLNPRTWIPVFAHRRYGVDAGLAPDHPGVHLLRQVCSILEGLPSSQAGPPPETAKQAALLLLDRIRREQPEVWTVVEENLRWCNGIPGDPPSFDPLDALLQAQAWQLAYWKVAIESVGYRRFFDISDLIGVRVERPEVFELTHSLILKLVEENKVDGLRLDHVDGLLDPERYLLRLREAVDRRSPAEAGRVALYVEKILAADESLPASWPVEGTTGYENLRWINSVLLDPAGLIRMEDAFRKALGRRLSFEEVVREAKREVLQELFVGELEGLARRLARIAAHDRHGHHLLRRTLDPALGELTSSLPVYRTYVRDFSPGESDRRRLQSALEDLGRGPLAEEPDLLLFLQRVFLCRPPHYFDSEMRRESLEFLLRWQQLTGPVMAKGLEDTAHYRYIPLLACNEVGGEPAAPSDPSGELHRRMSAQAREHPHALVTTSTHDTKRSEDVRARLCVLSELAPEWERAFKRWRRLRSAHRRSVRGSPSPDPSEEWLLFQTLLGTWPLQTGGGEGYLGRIGDYLIKAARESKRRTSWHKPDTEHEATILTYLQAALAPGNAHFRRSFLPLQRKVAFYGAINSLSQLAIKTAVPGVPDFYQGTELWDFSLVDPDNRRPVDFERRRARLKTLLESGENDRGALCSRLLRRWKDGRIKLYLTHVGLSLRARFPRVFLEGKYLPLVVQGARREHLLAFARRFEDQWILLLAPRLPASLSPVGRHPIGEDVWADTAVILPPGAPTEWRNQVDGSRIGTEVPGTEAPGEPKLRASSALRSFPVALLSGGSPGSGG